MNDTYLFDKDIIKYELNTLDTDLNRLTILDNKKNEIQNTDSTISATENKKRFRDAYSVKFEIPSLNILDS